MKDSISYGKRWVVESIFSSMKRMFGEYVSAVKYPNMVKEIMLKVSLYNLFISQHKKNFNQRIIINKLMNHATEQKNQ